MVDLEEIAGKEIRGIYRKESKIFSTETKASEVLGYLQENNKYEALIHEGDKIGLVTVRDLFKVRQPTQTEIGDYPGDLWGVFRAAPPEATVLDVSTWLLSNKVRAIPVREEDGAVGIISQRELLDEVARSHEFSDYGIEDVMSYPVTAMEVDEGVGKARKRMQDEDISHVPITKGGKISGIVTAQDLVYRFIKPIGETTSGDFVGERVPRYVGDVKDIMDKVVFSVGTEASARDAAREIMGKNSSYCLVIKEQAPIGIVTPRDLLRPLLDYVVEEEMPVYIVGLTAEEDWFDQAVAESKVRRVVERALKIHPHLQEARVVIEKQRRGGNRSLYDVRIGVYTKKANERFRVQEDGWDLLAVFDEAVRALDEMIRDKKHGPIRRPKWPPSPAPPGS
jgi:CBS domain-containing protein/ribosome-associated translation inhibitor RaiA